MSSTPPLIDQEVAAGLRHLGVDEHRRAAGGRDAAAGRDRVDQRELATDGTRKPPWNPPAVSGAIVTGLALVPWTSRVPSTVTPTPPLTLIVVPGATVTVTPAAIMVWAGDVHRARPRGIRRDRTGDPVATAAAPTAAAPTAAAAAPTARAVATARRVGTYDARDQGQGRARGKGACSWRES